MASIYRKIKWLFINDKNPFGFSSKYSMLVVLWFLFMLFFIAYQIHEMSIGRFKFSYLNTSTFMLDVVAECFLGSSLIYPKFPLIRYLIRSLVFPRFKYEDFKLIEIPEHIMMFFGESLKVKDLLHTNEYLEDSGKFIKFCMGQRVLDAFITYFGRKCFKISFKKIPLHINEVSDMEKEILKWRLRIGK